MCVPETVFEIGKELTLGGPEIMKNLWMVKDENKLKEKIIVQSAQRGGTPNQEEAAQMFWARKVVDMWLWKAGGRGPQDIEGVVR